jgi:hypothetical protein
MSEKLFVKEKTIILNSNINDVKEVSNKELFRSNGCMKAYNNYLIIYLQGSLQSDT